MMLVMVVVVMVLVVVVVVMVLMVLMAVVVVMMIWEKRQWPQQTSIDCWQNVVRIWKLPKKYCLTEVKGPF